ncbi:MAG: response regulator transcription factor [SAR202 cluster bacterium]|nr:response regulator transcription factor [SAR202 cluster bacterium]
MLKFRQHKTLIRWETGNDTPTLKGPTMDKTTALVVDDQEFFTEMLTTTLSSKTDIEVVGVAHDGPGAIRLALEKSPDAVLMDIELGGTMNGLEAASAIKDSLPDTGIVILSMHNDRRYVTNLLQRDSPGWSYLLKQSLPDVETLVRAISGSIAGWPVVDPAVMANLSPREGTPVSRLTPRLSELLQCIAQGYNNAAIAEIMGITERSVEAYTSNVYRELDISGEQDIHARVKATLLYLQDLQA